MTIGSVIKLHGLYSPYIRYNFPPVNNDFKTREAACAVQNLSAPDLSAANNKLAS